MSIFLVGVIISMLVGLFTTALYGWLVAAGYILCCIQGAFIVAANKIKEDQEREKK